MEVNAGALAIFPVRVVPCTIVLGDLSSPPGLRQQTLFRVLAAISFSHLLNDTIQSLLPAIYPILKASLST